MYKLTRVFCTCTKQGIIWSWLIVSWWSEQSASEAYQITSNWTSYQHLSFAWTLPWSFLVHVQVHTYYFLYTETVSIFLPPSTLVWLVEATACCCSDSEGYYPVTRVGIWCGLWDCFTMMVEMRFCFQRFVTYIRCTKPFKWLAPGCYNTGTHKHMYMYVLLKLFMKCWTVLFLTPTPPTLTPLSFPPSLLGYTILW